jgi:hypothetical protein
MALLPILIIGDLEYVMFPRNHLGHCIRYQNGFAMIRDSMRTIREGGERYKFLAEDLNSGKTIVINFLGGSAINFLRSRLIVWHYHGYRV